MNPCVVRHDCVARHSTLVAVGSEHAIRTASSFCAAAAMDFYLLDGTPVLTGWTDTLHRAEVKIAKLCGVHVVPVRLLAVSGPVLAASRNAIFNVVVEPFDVPLTEP